MGIASQLRAKEEAAKAAKSTGTKSTEVGPVAEIVEFGELKVALDSKGLAIWKQIEAACETVKPNVFKLAANETDDDEKIDIVKDGLLALDTFKNCWLTGDKHTYASVYQSAYTALLAEAYGCEKASVLAWKDGNATGVTPERFEPAEILILRSVGGGHKTARLVDLVPICKAAKE